MAIEKGCLDANEALYMAIREGYPDLVKILLQRDDVDPNQLIDGNLLRRDGVFKALTPLGHALDFEGESTVQILVRLLLEHKEINASVPLGKQDDGTLEEVNDALTSAICKGYVETVKHLLDHHSVDPNKYCWGVTPAGYKHKEYRETVPPSPFLHALSFVFYGDDDDYGHIIDESHMVVIELVDLLLSYRHITVALDEHRGQNDVVTLALEKGYLESVELLLACEQVDKQKLSLRKMTPSEAAQIFKVADNDNRPHPEDDVREDIRNIWENSGMFRPDTRPRAL